MKIFPDRPVDLNQINLEIAVLRLPDFVGTARMVRDLDTGDTVPPYILVKVGDLDATQEAALTTVVDAHVPAPPLPPTEDELRQAELRDKLAAGEVLTPQEVSDLMRLDRGL